MLRTQRAIGAIAVIAFILVPAIAGSAQAAPPAAPSNWHVGVYNPPQYRALSEGLAALPGSGLATFNFTTAPNTALLLNTQGSQTGNLLGNIAGETITATFTISDPLGSPFTYYGEPDACGTAASARLYFETSKAGGFNPGQYWWFDGSANGAVQLAPGEFTLTAPVSAADWSDWDGKLGTQTTADKGYGAPSAWFAKAAANVTGIGLSFGGGCFYANGVGAAGASLTLTSFTVN